MKNILIWRSVKKSNEWDIFTNIEYKSFYDEVSSIYGDNCPNWGNKLWFQGLWSEIHHNNNLEYLNNQTIEEINANYDMIIYPMANFFGIEHRKSMVELSELFGKIKIPVFIIACGTQAKNYNELENLISEIGKEAKAFISAIYNTGGEFALRGEFTKAFFTGLGFDSPVVTGCPSLYQFGRNFSVDNTKVDIQEFSPMFNGKLDIVEKGLKSYGNSVYIDQEKYFSKIYNPDYKVSDNFKGMLSYYRYFDIYSAELLAENRIKHIPNMNDWYTYLKKSNFNYSFGSRIHGSIMAILSGIPATVTVADARTTEMAEFFNIPYVKVNDNQKFNSDDIYNYYLEADYSKFNSTYQAKYDNYRSFLVNHGIVEEINENNEFFNIDKGDLTFENYEVNACKFKDLSKKMKRVKPLLKVASTLADVKEKINK